MAFLKHTSLNAMLVGVESDFMVHYRGIPYGTVTRRFTDPQIKSDFGGLEVDCTKFGPRCPQTKIDVGYLLREPEGHVFFDDAEDELQCLNLDVAVPKSTQSSALPVFFWVHGGSQIVSYGNGASKVGDVRKLVKHSVDLGLPMIVVSVQYRLNIFHVGDSPERGNFGFKDLQCALRWVREHISGFNGDPDSITLAGESAGAALAHGLVVAGADVNRAMLMSGTLFMSPPRPHAMADTTVIQPISQRLTSKNRTLTEASAEMLVRIQSEIPIVSVFLQEGPEFTDWMTSMGKVQELMVGDCEYESAIFRNGIESMTAEQIDDAFSKAGKSAEKLKRLYHINRTRPASCKAGALDFLNDLFWVMPTSKLKMQFKAAGKPVFEYLFDQTNPWQSSARAHHAVDLLHLFEGFDISENTGAITVAQELRRRVILFVNGQSPWSPDRACSFGPHGNVTELTVEDVAGRRRMKEMNGIMELSVAEVAAVRFGLTDRTLSLHN